MTTLPRTVTHKVTGEQITFLETAEETKGEYLYIEVSLPPYGKGPPLHIHNEFVEVFEVIEGKLLVQVGKQKQVLSVGEQLEAPIGTAHTFSNPHEDGVTFRVKLTPPTFFEQSVRVHYGLMDDGLTNEKGDPLSVSHTALILFLQNTWVAGIPLWIQKRLFNWAIRKGIKKGEYSQLNKYVDGIEALIKKKIEKK